MYYRTRCLLVSWIRLACEISYVRFLKIKISLFLSADVAYRLINDELAVSYLTYPDAK
jgi:hypothetical protein